MDEKIFSLDGEEFDLDVLKLQREFSVGEQRDICVTLDGSYHREIAGTYYHYTMTVRARNGNYSELDRFWEKVSQPVERIVCRFPYGQGYLTQEMYVAEGKQELITCRDSNRWDGITIRFVAAKPQVTA